MQERAREVARWPHTDTVDCVHFSRESMWMELDAVSFSSNDEALALYTHRVNDWVYKI